MDFTCNATGISVVLFWKLNNQSIASYTFLTDSHRYPHSLNLTINLPGTNATVNSATTFGAGNSINVVSTLSVSNVAVLNGGTIQCQDNFRGKSNKINTGTDLQGEKLVVFYPYREVGFAVNMP